MCHILVILFRNYLSFTISLKKITTAYDCRMQVIEICSFLRHFCFKVDRTAVIGFYNTEGERLLSCVKILFTHTVNMLKIFKGFSIQL
jgi:hypothetical protein